MDKFRRRIVTGLAVIVLAGGVAGAVAQTSMKAGDKGGSTTVLGAAEAGKILPASVFFRGQSATTQLRNSGGVKFEDGMFVLATLVDTSGYSSEVQQKYQAYFITEVPIKIEGHDLPAGIYGVGFVTGDQFVVLDVGSHDLFSVGSHADADLKRPTPLKVTAEGTGFRLYEGRKYVSFTR